MVPLPLWGRNLRAIMGKATHWRRLRATLLDLQGLVCSGCGKEVLKASDLKAHEEWTYLERSDPAVAWLRRVSLVCFHCHAVEHPGVLNKLIALGDLTERARVDTIDHFCAINKTTKRRWAAQLKTAEKVFDRRSCRDWYIDYGPFTEWVATTFQQDPLNECSWPEQIYKKWNGASGQPTIESVVASFDPDAIPTSKVGAIAHLYETIAVHNAAERKRKAEKRKRVKLKAERAAAKASRLFAGASPQT